MKGEVLAHVLNGVINKLVRDALLLQLSLIESRQDTLRPELLTSRLVRCHWDGRHMAAVRAAYHERCDRPSQDAIKDATSGQWGKFCLRLCDGPRGRSVAKEEQSQQTSQMGDIDRTAE